MAYKSGIDKLSDDELKEIAQVFVNLQTKILTATYDNRNYVAEILKYKQALKTNRFNSVVNDSNDDMIDIDYSYAHLVRVSQRKSRLPSYYLRLQQEYY